VALAASDGQELLRQFAAVDAAARSDRLPVEDELALVSSVLLRRLERQFHYLKARLAAFLWLLGERLWRRSAVVHVLP
jgi:hypothetical protein